MYRYNSCYKHLSIWILVAILLSPTLPCEASVHPPASNKVQKKKIVRAKRSQTRLSFKRPDYYNKKTLDYRYTPKSPNQRTCEGPDLGETIGILLLLVLAWAVPTGILVLLGLILGITWLWILGLVLFLIPVVFFSILLIGVIVS